MKVKVFSYWSTFFKICRKSKIHFMFLGFLILYLLFSSAIYYYDKAAFNNFGDALWFTFVSIFSIGYGDFTVHSAMSRVLTVILVIYGSIIIAVFTGIWVNMISKVTNAIALEDDENYDKLCNLEQLSKEELIKLSHFFKKRKKNKK